VMHEHMKGWLEADHKVTLFSSEYPGSVSKEVLDGVRIVRGGSQYLGVQFEGFKYYLANKEQFDLVVDQFHGIPFFTPLYVKKPILAVLQEVAGKVWLKNDLPWPLNWVVGLVGYLTEPLVFLFYKKTPFMVGSNSAREDLVKMKIPNKHITIVPHGVILPNKILQYPKEKVKTILFFGAVSKDKGIDDALEVFSLLNKKDEYQFWIAGRVSEYYRHLIRRRAKELDISVNIEANAMGTPVVAYKLPGLIDSVKQGVSGLLSESITSQGLTRLVEELLRDIKKYETCCANARMWSQNFTWDKSKKLSLELLEKCLNT